MKTTKLLIMALETLALCGANAADEPVTPSPYEVVWDSPSHDTNGTMPRGNGEIALNAWIEPSGDLRFYIARTDSWDDSGRLVKVGAVRIKVGDGPTDRTKMFRQILTAKDGTLSARYSQGDAQVDLRLWVDANRPVIYVEAQTPKPTTASATMELWRNAATELPEKQCSDVLNCPLFPEKTVVEPDTVLSELKDRIGWYHRNIKSVGPANLAKMQGVEEFPRAEPLLHRTFGALIAVSRPQRVDDRTLRSTAGTSHLFEIAVVAKHPATVDQWLGETQTVLDTARKVNLADRRAAHEKWWSDFWNRSWIHITSNDESSDGVRGGIIPANKHPLSIGVDQSGGNRFSGAFGRFGVYSAALKDGDVLALATTEPDAKAPEHPARIFSAVPEGPKALPDLDQRAFVGALTIEAWIKPSAGGPMRIADKLTPGGSDGFLLDTLSGTDLRLILGDKIWTKAAAYTTGVWQHTAFTLDRDGRVTVYVNGKPVVFGNTTHDKRVAQRDTYVLSRAYAMQRYMSACVGRGNYPIKFNGSLFTVPAADKKLEDADYRQWGPGYWWQNTRLPYHSMCAAGDFEMMDPLFNMYARDLMPFLKFRTKKYLGHGGAYIPECIYFWGDMFAETYGPEPFATRADKLQASEWHKYEWVSGPELVTLLLDRYAYTEDAKFLRETVLPAARELLGFFDQHYKTRVDGKLDMQPSQALETWVGCVNPMPELAGLHSTTARLLALPEDLTSQEDRAFWKQLQGKLPPLPTTKTPDGKVMLAPADVYKQKNNSEVPELYAVFPFRQIAIGKPNLEWGVEALNHRIDKGASGWRQDDIFMAYLGEAAQARDYVVARAKSKNEASRFPTFWGPNFDWIPDQDHGSVLLIALQSMLLQADGRKIYLLPAWPKDWDCEFKLHAPYNTTVEGVIKAGKLENLKVTPESRAKDIVNMNQAGAKQ
ncbi:MAG: DUF5703 domain-containing protein [Verrucomicrobiota bacterium]